MAKNPVNNRGDQGTDALAVLVVGVYLQDRPNNILEITRALASSHHHVTQKWVAFGEGPPPKELLPYTTAQEKNMVPKFVTLNRLLAEEDLAEYAFVIVCDDDISLPDGFLDDYLRYLNHYGFSLAQPARTRNSYIDHHFVGQMQGLKARRTRFVEIGPVFSIRQDAFDVLLPFDETSPMGWGYDFRWPCVIDEAGLRMGIIDATPVEHSMRKPVENYDYSKTLAVMDAFLKNKQHLSADAAFRILESFA